MMIEGRKNEEEEKERGKMMTDTTRSSTTVKMGNRVEVVTVMW